MVVDAARLTEQLTEQLATLAGFSDAPAPAVTRVVYTQADLDARAYLKTLIAEVGLSVREDALGNLFARWEGQKPDLPAVATGSHIDAIPFSGRFDGTVGVLGGLEAIRALKTSGFQPRRSLELILFTAEEPTRFGVGCFGSRALAGALTPDALAELKGDDGLSVLEAARQAGFSGDPSRVRLEPGHYHTFTELHIEQGTRLEAAGVPIGVVSAIAAPATLNVTLSGSGGHAGAVLMRRAPRRTHRRGRNCAGGRGGGTWNRCARFRRYGRGFRRASGSRQQYPQPRLFNRRCAGYRP